MDLDLADARISPDPARRLNTGMTSLTIAVIDAGGYLVTLQRQGEAAGLEAQGLTVVTG